MKRYLVLTFALLLLATGLIAACSPSSNARASGGQSSEPPAALTEDPQNTPAAVSHGGPVVDYVSLIDHLRTGATVEPAGKISQSFFPGDGYLIKVNGADVQVFEYADPAAADEQAVLVAPDGSSVGTSMPFWVSDPHFYKQGKIIVLYVGDDSGVLKALESALGPQFAGR